VTTTSQSADGSAERQLALTNELLASGIPIELHDRLSYRVVSAPEAKKLVGISHPGWVVAYIDLAGRPMDHNGKPFFRLKKEQGSPKYLTPKGAGCRPYFSPLLNPEHVQPGKKFRIVEGEKKADSMCANGRPAIALAGVDAWQDGRNGTGELLPELLNLKFNGSTVFIVYDSDVATKEQVHRAITGLACCLTEEKAKVLVVLLPCELDGTKNGVDDFIARHGIAAYDELERIARPADAAQQKGETRPTSMKWVPEPPNSHHCAVTAAVVFKESYANHPHHGLYEWSGTCWQLLEEKPDAAIDLPLCRWMDEMGWERRTCGHMSALRRELLVRLKHSNWDPNHLLAFSNGTLNIQSGAFISGHSKEDHLTQAFPFPYDPDAECPAWLAFLDETFQGDGAVIRLLRAAFHWSLIPKDPDSSFSHELIFEFIGRRGSGKGTIADVLTAVCGGIKNVGRITSSNFGKDTGLASLIGKRVAIEHDVSGHLSAAGVLNSVISNEPVNVKFLYHQEFETRLGIVIWRFYNNTPTASGEGLEGIGRRLVRFQIPKPAAHPDPGLKPRLLQETPGIFAWAWSMSDAEMADAFKNRGQVAAIRESSIEGQLASMPWITFLDERYPAGAINIPAQSLYNSYKEWAKDNGRAVCSHQTFGENIKKLPWVYQKRTNNGKVYTIRPYTRDELAVELGVSVAGVPVAGTQRDPVHPGGTPREQLHGSGSEEMVYQVYDFPQKLEKDLKELKPLTEKEFATQWYTSYTAHQNSLAVEPAQFGSGYDVASDGDDPYWPPRGSVDLGNGRTPE
jgi:putative DNA primase/helicase